MSRRAKPSEPAPVGDSFQNLIARVGLNAGNLNAGGKYDFSPVSRDRVMMENCYRSSWIAGQAVDTVAQDMTREGVEMRGDIDPQQIEVIERATSRLRLWDSLCDTVKWSRLYGGCVAVLMIDGQKVETPLRRDTIGRGQFKGLLVLDRWVVQPSLTDLVTDFGPEIGKPRFYQVIADAQGLMNMKIHHSRVIRLDGTELPYWQRIAENGWGQSVLERLWDRLIPYDSITQGASQLVFKAHLRTYKVKGLREILAMGGKAEQGLLKQIEAIRVFQSNEGLTLMDGEDEFDATSYTFSGLSDLMLQFAQQISGATGIPLVRLLGQSPAGMSATGESDIRLYYDNISQMQERQLRSGINVLYDILYRSEIGTPPPENFDFDFKSLWQLDDVQKAAVATSVTTAVAAASDAGIIDRATALKELRQSGHVTGVWTQITDEDITEAEAEPPPSMSELDNDADAGQKAGEGSGSGE